MYTTTTDAIRAQEPAPIKAKKSSPVKTFLTILTILGVIGIAVYAMNYHGVFDDLKDQIEQTDRLVDQKQEDLLASESGLNKLAEEAAELKKKAEQVANLGDGEDKKTAEKIADGAKKVEEQAQMGNTLAKENLTLAQRAKAAAINLYVRARENRVKVIIGVLVSVVVIAAVTTALVLWRANAIQEELIRKQLEDAEAQRLRDEEAAAAAQAGEAETEEETTGAASIWRYLAFGGLAVLYIIVIRPRLNEYNDELNVARRNFASAQDRLDKAKNANPEQDTKAIEAELTGHKAKLQTVVEARWKASRLSELKFGGEKTAGPNQFKEDRDKLMKICEISKDRQKQLEEDAQNEFKNYKKQEEQVKAALRPGLNAINEN